MPKNAEKIELSAYFALAGLVFAAVLGAVMVLCSRLFYGLSLPVAALLVALMALATRGRYWSGLGAVANAWFLPKEHRLAAMGEAGTTSVGVVAIVFVALIEVGALQGFAAPAMAGLVVLAPVFGRMAAFFSAALGKAARMEAQPICRPSGLVIASTVLALAAAGALAWVIGVDPILLAAVGVFALLVALVVPHLVAEHFGGVTWETAEASVVLSEMLVLLGALAVAGVLRLLGWVA